MKEVTFEARVYPLENPEHNTLAFANVGIAVDGASMVSINGVRVVDGTNGVFVSMPQTQDRQGLYHDTAFPLSKELRDDMIETVLAEFGEQIRLAPEQRGYEYSEQDTAVLRNVDDINLDIKVFPVKNPRGDTLAFASVGFDDVVAIRGIRVVNDVKGMYVTMPQTQDNEGEFHTVARPIAAALQRAVSKEVLAEFKQQVSERKPSVKEQLREGKDAAAQRNSTRAAERAVQPQTAYAKRSAGNVGQER